jgi:hypothetical protein
MIEVEGRDEFELISLPELILLWDPFQSKYRLPLYDVQFQLKYSAFIEQQESSARR